MSKVKFVTTISIVAPTVNDDITQGFIEGAEYLDIITNTLYRCKSNTVGNADWVVINRGSSIPAFNAGGSTIQLLKITTGNVLETIDTVVSSLSVGILSDFPGLSTESNWVNNINITTPGIKGDRATGIFQLGNFGIAEYSQYGWFRHNSQPYITDSTLITELEDTDNWTDYTYNASTGDVEMRHTNGSYQYFCISGITHTWIRIKTFSGEILVPDITYFPEIAVSIVSDNGTLTIPIQHKVESLVLKENDTSGGNFSIGSADGSQDIVTEFALSGTAGTLFNLDYKQLNSMLSETTTKTLYINISTSASVTLRMRTQKF